MKPRLLIILNRLSIGGPASNTLAMAHLLSSRFEVLLLAGEPLPEEQSAAHLLQQYTGFRVELLPGFSRAINPSADIRSYRTICRYIQTFRPGVVHTHGSKPGLLGRVAAYRLGVTVIFHTFHGHVFHGYFHPILSGLIVQIERWLAKRSTALIAINQQLQQDLVQHYKIAPAGKVVLNRLGVNQAALQDADGQKRSRFRDEVGLLSTDIVIGIVGRLVPIKQHRLFVELAAALLAVPNHQSRLRFVIVGDGAEKPKIEKWLQQHQLSFAKAGQSQAAATSVIFTGWRQDMDAVMAGLDVLLLTSRNEGTPVSILEAMAAAKPVVATAVGGISELLQQAQCGSCSNNPQQLQQQLQTLINDAGLRHRWGQNGYEFVKNQLSLEQQANELEKIAFEALNMRITN